MGYAAKGRTKNFPVFDCDSHIYEPPEIWDKYIPQNNRDFAKTHFIATPIDYSWCATAGSAFAIRTNGNIPAKPGIPA